MTNKLKEPTRFIREEGVIKAARNAHRDLEELDERGLPFGFAEWERARTSIRALGEALAGLDALSELSGEPATTPEKPVRAALPWHEHPAFEVKSSNLTAARYDPSKATMEVAFRSGGVYRYAQVPAEVWAEFTAAQSKGRFFQQRIKGRFAHERLGV